MVSIGIAGIKQPIVRGGVAVLFYLQSTNIIIRTRNVFCPAFNLYFSIGGEASYYNIGKNALLFTC